MTRVEVSVEQCAAIGKILQKLTLKPKVFERDYITFKADPEIKLRAYLFSVGICHQTHTLISKKSNLVGFNYLEAASVRLAQTCSPLLDPFFVSRQDPQKLSDDLALLFSDTGDRKDSTLDRLDERVELLVDMNRKLVEKYSGKISTLFEISKGRADGEQGLYQLLSDFIAYSDPLKKKSTLFITIAQSAGLLNVQDVDNMIPIMDYHMQRVLLRLGCVEIRDAKLRNALIKQEKIDTDEEIRSASIEAIRELARHSGHHATAIHDFLWPLGRSCCKEKPLCKSGVCDKKPCTFDLFVNLSEHKKCVFDGTCKGSLHEEYIKLWQPIVETHYY
jgi:hypothetical protein